jgi:hypothetical protein
MPPFVIPSGTRVLRPRRAVAIPRAVGEVSRPLPPLRPLEILGGELYPAEGIRPPSREYYPGSIYPDEIEAIEQVMPSLTRDIQEGSREGYDQWYHMGPMQELFRSEWGQKVRGDREFRRAMGLSSASSNSTPVPQEIKKGSLLFNLYHQGTLPEVANYDEAVKRIRLARTQGLVPKGYSGRTQGLDLYQAMRFLDGRLGFPTDVTSTSRYKLGDYYNSKVGGEDAGAMDTHVHRWLGLQFDPRSYATARAAISQAGGGRPLSQSQPSLWMIRGAKTPDFDSVAQPSLMHWYEAAAIKRAEQTGEDPLTVLRKFARGKGVLAGLLPAMAAEESQDNGY